MVPFLFLRRTHSVETAKLEVKEWMKRERQPVAAARPTARTDLSRLSQGAAGCCWCWKLMRHNIDDSWHDANDPCYGIEYDSRLHIRDTHISKQKDMQYDAIHELGSLDKSFCVLFQEYSKITNHGCSGKCTHVPKALQNSWKSHTCAQDTKACSTATCGVEACCP